MRSRFTRFSMKRTVATLLIAMLAALLEAAEPVRRQEVQLKFRDDQLWHSLHSDHDELTRKRNLAAAYPAAIKVWADDTLPARIRLAVMGTAGKACERAMRKHSSPTGATYQDCPEATNAIPLIEMLTQALATIPQGPPGVLNVSPPILWNGGGAAGMDPDQIPDPVARDAYKAAIAENKLRIEEGNARQRVRMAIQELEIAVSLVIREIEVHHKASPMPDIIRKSSLPEETKQRLLAGRLR